MAQEIERVLRDPAFTAEFRILSREGEGGMGMVFKAIQTSLNRTVAVKILLPSLFSDEDVARRLEREAQLTSELRKHENIVRLLTYGKVSGLPYLVYEFVEGESLTAVIAREAPMRPTRAIELVNQLLNGLAHAHKHRIIHRDVKPDNALLDKFNNVKVMDFGIALGEMSGERLTREGVIIGTPVYMAPEQASGRGVTGQADVYAAAVILYEMLTGRLPWEQESALAVLAEKVSGRFIRLGDVAPALPERLIELVDQALDTNPNKRPAGAAAMRQQLEEIAIGLTGMATGPIAVPPPKSLDRTRAEDRHTAQQTRAGPRVSQTELGAARPPVKKKVPLDATLRQTAIWVLATAALLAAVALAIIYTTSRSKGGGGEFTFSSASARFLEGGKVAVLWHCSTEVSPVAEIYRSDGEGEAARKPMEHSGGKYEAIFGDLDPWHDYSFKVMIPELMGAAEASEPQRLKGAASTAEQLRRLIEALDIEAIAATLVRQRRAGLPATEAAHGQRPRLIDVENAMKRLEPIVGSIWKGDRAQSADRWNLFEALGRLEELEWRAAAVGVHFPFDTGRLLGPERGQGCVFPAPASECRFTVDAHAPPKLLPGLPVKVTADRCEPPAAAAANLSAQVSGSAGRPYFLIVSIGTAGRVRIRGSESAAASSVCRSFDAWPLAAGLAKGLTVELKLMEMLTHPAEASGVSLETVTLRVR